MDLIIIILPVVTKDLPISPRFTPYNFLSRCKFGTLTTRQPMVEFYLLTFPHFPLREKEHKSYFGKNRTHDFPTSRCVGYLLDHSGDEWQRNFLCYLCSSKPICRLPYCPFCSSSLDDPASQLNVSTCYLMRSYYFYLKPQSSLRGNLCARCYTDTHILMTDTERSVRRNRLPARSPR